MIDLNRLEELLHGNKELIEKFIHIFKAQTPVQLSALDKSVHEEDWSQVSITAHAIKSQCKYMGLDKIADHAYKIELLSENQEQLNLIPGLVVSLRNQIESIIDAE